MSPPSDDLPETADGIRDRNAELDAELLRLFDLVPEDRLHEPFGDDWTLAHNLAHIAEFPRYFAVQLQQWFDGDRVVIGRVAEHDADRNDAIARAPDRTVVELRDAAVRSFAELSDVLEALTDEHVMATTHNVKYGEEPLRDYLQRYVVGHKAAHAEQLRAALEVLGV